MKSRKRKYSLCGMLLISILLMVSGCTGKTSEKETDFQALSSKDNLTVIGCSQLGSESVWRTANTNSIKNIFTKENGYFLIFNNARQKKQNQVKALRSFISQQVDYIVFSPITENGWETVLQEAKEAQIPVILIDRKVNVEDETLYTSWIGSDFEREGKRAGKVLLDILKEQQRSAEDINIVVLKGTEGASATIGRTNGFDYVVKQHKNWKVLEQQGADFTTAKGKEEMAKIIRRHQKIDVVIAQNDDMMFGAVEAIKEAGKTTGIDGDIIVISFDATKQALEMLQDGTINADVECNPVQGEYIERIIQKIKNGDKVNKSYFMPEKVFTKDNVEEYLEKRTY